MQNRVSIVTPVYNGEGYLSRMLDSVLRQSYRELEMILVDGGSGDGTLVLAEGYRQRFEELGIEYRILTGGGSAAAGLNRGFPFVTGEFLIWPDADDVLEKESVKKRVDFLRKCPDYQCVRSLAYYVLEETGERTREDERRGDLTNENLFFPVLNAETFVCCGCYMFRTERFFEIYPERRIPDSFAGQNLQMLLPFLYRYPCPTIREELYRVYVRPGSHSRALRTEKEERERCEEFQTLIDTLAEICGITGKREKQLVESGKARIRYQTELKYGKKWRAAAAVIDMMKNGGITFGEFLEKAAYIFAGKLVASVKERQRGGKNVE
ncbi:MAG: glycosyltransferase family A protein [Blautia wexlerae]